MKRTASVITAALAVLLGACGTQTQIQEKAMAENGNTAAAETMAVEETAEAADEGLSKEDRKAFATGISTEADNTEGASQPGTRDAEGASKQEAADAAPGETLPEGIEERCPEAYTAVRTDVNYGEFTHGTYFSTTCGLERGYSILLPADYSEDGKYPVLYLLHGIFGDEYSFSGDANNRIKEIVGNMAADGLIEEMIVVCPNMYASSDPDQKPAFDVEACLPYDNFINDLVTDLMPCIESTYSVRTGRENTYLAGFSMGGRETIYITLQRPELFGYVCAISAAPGIVPTTDKFMTHPGQITESEMKFADGAVTPEVFILCCGSRDSVVGEYPKSYHELLAANATDHIWYEIAGADHDNNAIRSGIYNLLKLIGSGKRD
ncbi:MAG: esterase family protein [Lachnospiraceae bacterium]|nr:esterase family protein [Lachnospiraceae bacterium]